MKKKPVELKGVENRLLGFERRVTKLEDKVDEFRHDLIHNQEVYEKVEKLEKIHPSYTRAAI